MSDEDKLTSEDILAICNCAQRLREMNTKHYGEPAGIEVARRVAANAEKVADKIERRLSA
jgi:hypothetical protein